MLTHLSKLDRIVILEFLLVLIASIIMFVFVASGRDAAMLGASLDRLFPVLAVAAILISTSLVLWMTIGHGIESSLWNWLPPFVLLRSFPRTVRALFVAMIVVGTLVGICTKRIELKAKQEGISITGETTRGGHRVGN